MAIRFLFAVPAVCVVAASCARVDVQPIEVKPIHITVDVNVRIDRELDQFFAFEEEVPAKPATTPATTRSIAAGTGPAAN